MRRRFVFVLVAACLFPIALSGTVAAFETISQEVIGEKTVEDVDIVTTAENLIIVFDGSSSTNEMVSGREISKIAAAKEILQKRNEWLPDADFNCGVYLTSGWSAFKTVHEVQNCNREDLGAIIDQLPEKGKGNDLLFQSMLKFEKVIEPLSGRTSVIWFTDNIINDIDDPERAVAVAQKINEKKEVRFYVISADETLENGVMENVAALNAESKVVPIKALLDQPDLLAESMYTTKVKTIVQKTPESKVVGFVTNAMLFDINSDIIRNEYTQDLDKVGKFLQEHEQISIVIQGHTDSDGPDKYNLSLSAKRAGQVRNYLLEKFGIDPVRVAALWYGDQRPVADNETAEGRQLNRRVEIAVREMQ